MILQIHNIGSSGEVKLIQLHGMMKLFLLYGVTPLDPKGVIPSKALDGWAEARLKIARMTLTIKLDGNWSSFQLANSAPPLSVTDSALAPSARMHSKRGAEGATFVSISTFCSWGFVSFLIASLFYFTSVILM